MQVVIVSISGIWQRCIYLFICCIVRLQFWVEFCKTANDLLGVLNIAEDWTIKHFATLLMLIISSLFKKKMYLIFNQFFLTKILLSCFVFSKINLTMHPSCPRYSLFLWAVAGDSLRHTDFLMGTLLFFSPCGLPNLNWKFSLLTSALKGVDSVGWNVMEIKVLRVILAMERFPLSLSIKKQKSSSSLNMMKRQQICNC